MSEPSIAAGLRSLANRQKYQIDSNLLMRLARDADLLAARLAEAEKWRDYYRAKWLGEFAVPQPDPPADSAPAVTCDHFLGQAVCEWCKGTGAIDAPTSADDPSCPECDGEGYV